MILYNNIIILIILKPDCYPRIKTMRNCSSKQILVSGCNLQVIKKRGRDEA